MNSKGQRQVYLARNNGHGQPQVNLTKNEPQGKSSIGGQRVKSTEVVRAGASTGLGGKVRTGGLERRLDDLWLRVLQSNCRGLSLPDILCFCYMRGNVACSRLSDWERPLQSE